MSAWLAPAAGEALHGPAGEFVALTSPHTEADPMALLAQFLVAFGAAAGRHVHYALEATCHHLNEFAILVGPSGKGRKGSSWDHVEALLSDVDPTFAERCVSSGLTSGEGLIWEVRDEQTEQTSGPSEKRRLVLESDFAQVRVRESTRNAARFASIERQLTFDAVAREFWIEVYGPLSRGEEGLLAAATRRAEAHVVRLAAIYATVDCAESISLPHLKAALALWRYSADSARWIFGDSLGDPTADDIWTLAKDRPAGVTRTEVRDLFSRNKKAREIDRALTILEEAGRLTHHHANDVRGRPAEVWTPVSTAA